MNSKYNNNKYSRQSPGDASMRFNKRPRYGANNSPRFGQQNQSYNYQHRNNISSPSGTYPSNNAYEQSQRNYYGHGSPNTTPIRRQQQQNNNKSQYRLAGNTNSSSISSGTATTTSTNKVPVTQPTTPKSVVMVAPQTPQLTTTQNVQETQSVPSEINTDFSYGYNNYFFPNYNVDASAASISAPTFGGLSDPISPFMWQTITSIPPPNMLTHPPLPQQLPPSTQPPPLPGGEMQLPPPPLHPPPPIPVLIGATNFQASDYREKGNERVFKPLVKMKNKRKAMSARYNLSKTWSQKDAELALKAEEDYMHKQQNDIILIIRFPDPEVNREIVKTFHPAIESVHFQLNFAPRYCFVHLKPDTDVEKAIDSLSKISFGSGYLRAEIKQIPSRPHAAKPCEIDPCTLYVGNLPTTIASKTLKEHFPGATRYDIGFAQRMKYTRYAFIRYQNVQDAIVAYKNMLDAEIDGRSVILRFRRTAASKEDRKDDAENPDDLPEDEYIMDDLSLSAPITATGISDDISSSRFQNESDNKDSNFERLQEENDLETLAQNNIASKINPSSQITGSAESTKTYDDIKHLNNNNIQNETIGKDLNTEKTNNRLSSTSTEVTQASSNLSLPQFIKPDPDLDPDDRVVRDETFTNLFDNLNESIKQENESGDDSEFFDAGKSNKNNNNEKTLDTDICSLNTTTDETESVSSLGEFLRTCQGVEQLNNMEPPPAKKNKTADIILENGIKSEPCEKSSKRTQEPIVTTAIKQEIDNVNGVNANNKSLEDICNIDEIPLDNFLQSIILDKNKEVPNRKEKSNKSEAETNLRQQSLTVPTFKNSKEDNLLQINHFNSLKENLNNSKPKSKTVRENSLAQVMENSNISKHKSKSIRQNPHLDNDDSIPLDDLVVRRELEIFKEFFDTGTQQEESIQIDKIKQEPLEIPNRIKTKDKKTASPRKTDENSQSTSKHSIEQTPSKNLQLNKIKPNISTRSLFNKETSINSSQNINTEDDIVPENCGLRPLELFSNNIAPNEIKREQDYDEFYSMSPNSENKTKNVDSDCDLRPSAKNNNEDLDMGIWSNDYTKHSSSGLTLNVNDREKTIAEGKKDSIKTSLLSNRDSTRINEQSDDDDDIIVVSQNFPPKSNTPSKSYSAESHLNTFSQSTIFSIKRNTSPIDHGLKSLYRYNKDKLYELLDSNSDSDF